MLAFLPNLSRVRAYLLGTMLALGTSVIEAQTQSNIQYTYDAAGNVIGVIRTSSAAKPDLTVSNLSVGKIIAVGDASFTIPVSFQVNNGGGVSAVASWYDRGYLSTTNVLHDTDQVLSGSLAHSTNLAAGASYTVNATLTTSTTTAAGAWTLIVKADGGASPSGQYGPTGANYVDEFNEINNTQSITINLPINPKPDLTVSNLVVGTISASQNGSYNIPATYQVNNVGNIFASPTWYDRGYLSTDAVLDNTDQILTGFHRQSTNLAVGASYTVSQTYVTNIGTTSGSYSLIVKADGGNSSGQYSPTGSNYVQEQDETNNTQTAAITLPVKADLTVSNLVVGTISANQNGSYNIPVTYQVNNVGGSPAIAAWNDRGYLSTDAVLDNADQILTGYHAQSTDLAMGASYTVSQTYVTSIGTTSGSYSLIVKADGGNGSGQYSPTGSSYVQEQNETNNTQVAAIALPAKADLTVTNLSVGTVVKNGNGSYSIPVTFQVNNVGGSPAIASWYDRGYLSTDAVLNNIDQILTGAHTQSTNLAVGANYIVSVTFTTNTSAASGTYYLIVKADGGTSGSGQYSSTGSNYVQEQDETNNVASVSVVLP